MEFFYMKNKFQQKLLKRVVKESKAAGLWEGSEFFYLPLSPCGFKVNKIFWCSFYEFRMKYTFTHT